MAEPDERLVILRLSRAFEVTLENIARQVAEGEYHDIGVRFGEFLAAMLDRVILRELAGPPAAQGILPLDTIHIVSAKVFDVMSGGMAGGPYVDLLIQIVIEGGWLTAGWGLPLVFRAVRPFGRISEAEWTELREVAKVLRDVSPSARVVLVSIDGEPFSDPNAKLVQPDQVVQVIPAHIVAGYQRPPRGMTGQRLDSFTHDFATGAIGDPQLAPGGWMLRDFLRIVRLGLLVEIRIVAEARMSRR